MRTGLRTSLCAVVAVCTMSDLAVGQSGVIASWGSNSHGQSDLPVGSIGFRHVAAGRYSTVAVTTDGDVQCWGSGDEAGYCGDVPPLGVIAIASGGEHVVALFGDRSVTCWGRNSLPSGEYSGQCNVPPNLPPIIAVAGGGYHTLALTESGQIRTWGWNEHGQCNAPAFDDFVAIAGGGSFSMGLRASGEVLCWGSNYYGQCSVPPLSDVISIAAGSAHAVALLSDGTVRCWGSDLHGQTSVPMDLPPVVAIAAGEAHTVALTADGVVRCWGRNIDGQCNVPSALGTVAAIAAGGNHTVVRLLRDCDLDGQDDDSAIADGLVADCDGDLVPDRCQQSSVAWAETSPFDASSPVEMLVSSADQLSSDLELRIRVRAELNGPLRFATLTMDGIVLTTAFLLDGQACDGGEQLAAIVIPGAQFAEAASDGEVRFELTASGAVSAASCPASRATLGLFTTSTPEDCDGNGTADFCEIAADPSLDLNNDGRLDRCNLARGDFDLDGAVGGSDLAVLLSLWGTKNPPIGDLTNDSIINGADLSLLLGNWGQVP